MKKQPRIATTKPPPFRQNQQGQGDLSGGRNATHLDKLEDMFRKCMSKTDQYLHVKDRSVFDQSHRDMQNQAAQIRSTRLKCHKASDIPYPKKLGQQGETPRILR